MKFLKVQWIIVLVLALVLSACGTDADTSDDTTTDTDAEITVTEEASTDDSDTEAETEDVDEADDEEETTEDSNAEATGNAFTAVGDDVDFEIVAFSGGSDYTPVFSQYDESAFEVIMTPTESGSFFPAVVIEGIPRDATVGTVISLQPSVDTGVACLIFQPEIMGQTALASFSGELTLTDYDGETASGTFEAVLTSNSNGCSPVSAGEPEAGSITVTGTFTDVIIPAEEE